MESTTKKTRTDHTTPEYRNMMKTKKEETRAKLTLQLNRLDREIAELEKPYVPKERKAPVRKASVAGIMKKAKASGMSAEDMEAAFKLFMEQNSKGE